MRTVEEIRAEIARVEAELEKPGQPRYRMAALWARADALRWLFGERSEPLEG